MVALREQSGVNGRRNAKDHQAEIAASLAVKEVWPVWPAFANGLKSENVTLKVSCPTASVPR